LAIKLGENNIHRKALEVPKYWVAYGSGFGRMGDIRLFVTGNLRLKITPTIVPMNEISGANQWEL